LLQSWCQKTTDEGAASVLHHSVPEAYMWNSLPRTVLVLILAGTVSGCTALEALRNVVQAPTFDEAPNRPAEIRLVGPSAAAPIGGAAVRLWARVTNPNGFGFTLSTLRGALFLEEARAATIDLPLGLPLEARGRSEFPIDLVISFTDLPGLRDVVRRAVNRTPIGYRLDGTIGVDAGRFGAPEFGPMTMLRGSIRGRDNPQ
jgi:hypothetical protein